MWDAGLDAASVDRLCMVLDLDYDKAVSTNQLKHWQRSSSPIQAQVGEARLLLSYSDGRTRISRLSSILPRVADLVIREAPVKPNLRF